MSRGRYAPSPTGSLHLGNVRTALAAWLLAREAGSSFVMRVEDLDEPRTRPEAVFGNLEELRWLGIDWDEGPDLGGPHAPYLQSRRHHLYQAALDDLSRRGLVFECYLSRRELREISSAPHGVAPVYGERERRLNRELGERKRAEGKMPALRLKVGQGKVRFVDGLAGAQEYDLETEVGDLVLRRADGAWAYGLAVVVDDAAMNIEQVVRGADLLPATAAQLAVYDALALPAPEFLHVPLLLDEGGERMAKRRGSLTMASLRGDGVDPDRLTGLLAHSLGLIDARRPTPAHGLPRLFERRLLDPRPFRLAGEDLEWLRAHDG